MKAHVVTVGSYEDTEVVAVLLDRTEAEARNWVRKRWPKARQFDSRGRVWWADGNGDCIDLVKVEVCS